jgi:two-component system, NtrC family, sensor kinase
VTRESNFGHLRQNSGNRPVGCNILISIVKPYVLFVDDDPSNLVVLEATCANDFAVLTARSAEAALEQMKKHEVGVLLTDQRMPVTTGVELLERVRTDYPDTIRMLVTAYSDLGAAIDAINRGQVRRYIKKPWQPDELKSELADALDVYRMSCRMRSLERRLLETERLYALGVVAAGIAHELRNPIDYIGGNLTHVKGALMSIRQALEGGEQRELAQARGRITDAIEAISEAEEGVRRIFDIVRGIELPTRQSHDETCDVAEVLRLTLRIVRGEMLATTELMLDVAQTPRVRGSSTKVGQVVLNLLVNAIQALSGRAREQNLIRVRVWREGSFVTLEVADNGPGIAEENQEKIFDPFFTTKVAGTGLGLAISRKIAEELGGRLELTSNDQGSKFRLVLPVSA